MIFAMLTLTDVDRGHIVPILQWFYAMANIEIYIRRHSRYVSEMFQTFEILDLDKVGYSTTFAVVSVDRKYQYL